MSNKNIDGFLLKNLVLSGYASLLEKKQEINDLNVFPVPDGDTGNNMSRTLENGIENIKDPNIKNDIGFISAALAEGMLLGARGNSGVILSQFFKGISLGLKGYKDVNLETFYKALLSGKKQAYKAVVTPTEGTILTVAREGIADIEFKINKDTELKDLMEAILNNMKVSLEETPNKLAVLKEAGVVDSGGAGLLAIFEGMYKFLNDGKVISYENLSHEEHNTPVKFNKNLFNADSELSYGYCTEFILQLLNKKCNPEEVKIEEFIEYLSTIGDSIVAFKDEDIIKVHVHTKTPSKAIEFAQKYGEFITFKMENMAIQNNEVNERKKEKLNIKKEHKYCGFVTVGQGDGIIDTFNQMNVDVVLNGGQTMNTSCEEFIDAFKEIDADHIIVLPNNKNILLAAKQAKSLYKDSKIHIIPTKSVAEGYFSLSMMNDPETEINEQLQCMQEGLDTLITGEVTYSIRDSKINGIEVKKGDYMSILDSKIVNDSKTSKEALFALIDNVENISDKQFIVIFVGQTGKDEDVNELKSYIESKNKFIDVGIIEGKQDIYDYILGIY